MWGEEVLVGKIIKDVGGRVMGGLVVCREEFEGKGRL